MYAEAVSNNVNNVNKIDRPHLVMHHPGKGDKVGAFGGVVLRTRTDVDVFESMTERDVFHYFLEGFRIVDRNDTRLQWIHLGVDAVAGEGE
jgi:hypothetical protein